MSVSDDKFLNIGIEPNENASELLDSDVVLGAQFSGQLYLPDTRVFAKIIGIYESGEGVPTDETKKLGSQIIKRSHFSDKSWYLIKLTHGTFEWSIKRTLSDFGSLNSAVNNQLRLRTLLLFGRGKPIRVGYFPSKIDILFKRKMDDRKHILEGYLQSLMDSDVLRGIDAVIRFFEISPMSFRERFGTDKWKEGMISKLPSHTLVPLCCTITMCRQPRWLVLKDSYLLYMKRKTNTFQRKGKKSSQPMSLETGQEQPNSYLLGPFKRQWRLCKVFLMDQTFAFVPRVIKSKRCYMLKLYNAHARLAVICPNETQLLEWNDALTAVFQNPSAMDYVDDNRFRSFAPPRPGTRMTVFIDGACYMEAVAKAIAQAKHEIFITDWCMNPEVFLRRPVRTNTWRLDKLLQAKAKQGVRICIMLYNGVEGIVPFSCTQTCLYLHSLHSNIHVYLSPTLIKFWSHHEKMVVVDQSIVFMGGIDLCYGRWDTINHRLEDVPKTSHVLLRETSLLDVTMRAEQMQKPVTHAVANKTRDDTGPINQLKPYQRGRSASESRSTVWHLPKPFKRNLPILKDRRTERVNGLNVKSSITKPKRNRHRHFTGVFEQAGDKLQTFFSRKTSTQTHNMPDVSYYEDHDLMYLEAQWGSHIQQLEGNVNVAYEDDVGTDNAHPNPNEVPDLESLCELGNLCTWVGQDYVNWNKGDPNPKLKAAQDLYDRNDVPRMPWHDIACVMSGKIACDFARHFIQRWNAIRNSRIRNAGKGTSERERRRRKPLLIPATPCSPWTENELNTVLLDPRQTAVCRAQALRSVCDWSLGIPAENAGRSARAEFRQWIKGDDRNSAASINTSKTSKIGLECSIHTAYVDSILNAERFVLIENQFFISFVTMTDEDALTAFDRSTDADTPNWDTQTSVQQDHNIHTRLQSPSHVATVKNRIADALFVRILRAHREQKPFRVFIILPLIPGFQGDFGDPSSGSQNRIHYFTRLSLFLGDSALIPRLGKFIPDPSEYISVCGLRTFDEWPNGNLKTNIIYVHSKFMVVDDKKMIIGSANLNDRSLRGKRDSEMAILIDSGAQSHANFNPFIRRVRRSLMAEHLGVLPAMQRAVRGEWSDELLDNPDSNEFFNNVWKATADKNAQIFEQVFNVIPANSLKTFNDCQQQRQKIPLSVGDPQNAAKLLKSIRGSLVTFPHEFLDEEDLTPPIATIENVAPSKLWT